MARRQRRVAEQVARGHLVPGADEALELFVGTLKTFEDYERLLHFEAERPASRPNGTIPFVFTSGYEDDILRKRYPQVKNCLKPYLFPKMEEALTGTILGLM